MKIELSSMTPTQLPAERSTKLVPNDGPAVDKSTEDRAMLSSGSASVQSLVKEALKSPEVRQDKVDALRRSISGGQYEMDAAKTAAAILSSNAK